PEVYAEAEPAAAAPVTEQPADAPTGGAVRPLSPRVKKLAPAARAEHPVTAQAPATNAPADGSAAAPAPEVAEASEPVVGEEESAPASEQTAAPPAARNRGRGAPARPGHGLAKGGERGRGFERDYYPPPRPMSLESRIAQSLNVPAAAAGVSDMKQVRLVEGSTVKEFADKLGIR